VRQRLVHDTGGLLASLMAAERAQRGFLLTAEEAYLGPYRRAVAETQAFLDRLAASAGNLGPDQASRVERLKRMGEAKLEELGQIVALRSRGGLDAALEAVRTDRDRALTENIRATCAEIENGANTRISQFTQESRESANQLGLVATLGGLILLALLSAATAAVHRGIRRRQELIEALQRSESELITSRDWFETTLASIGDAVIVADPAGRVTFLNRVAQAVTGWTREEAAGVALDRIFVIHEEESGSVVESPVTRVLRTGGVVGLANHTRLTSKYGRHIPIDDSAAPIRGNDGGIRGVVLVFRDVTERRQAEKALKDNAERVEVMFNASPIGVVAGDIYGRITEANNAFLTMTGYTREDLAAGNVTREALTPPEFRNADRSGIAEARQRGTCTPYEKEYKRKDGTRVPVYAGYAVVGEARDQVIGFAIDLTEIKTTAQSLRESHARFQRLVDSNVVGIVLADERHVIDANQIYLDMLGYSREDLVAGRVNWECSTAPEFGERDRSAIRQMRQQGYCAAYEKAYIRQDGTRVPMLIGAAVFSYEPELSWIAFVADLTRQKTLERELQFANERLVESNEELQRFAYVVAHDLRAPLRTVSSLATLLTRKFEGRLDNEIQELAGQIQVSTARMDQLISDVLEYSRAANAPGVSDERVDSSAAFAWAVMNLQAQIRQGGAKIIAAPLPAVMAGDQLVRVFQNLIDNALKYRGESPPEIQVAARRSGDEWVFSIRDNGLGFDMRYAEKIFGVFQRLHGRGKYDGSGIGLATSKRLIERYGGKMWAESQSGVGSTFYFSLPAAEQMEVSGAS
jgi:PAS domain S-box-containing protein